MSNFWNDLEKGAEKVYSDSSKAARKAAPVVWKEVSSTRRDVFKLANNIVDSAESATKRVADDAKGAAVALELPLLLIAAGAAYWYLNK